MKKAGIFCLILILLSGSVIAEAIEPLGIDIPNPDTLGEGLIKALTQNPLIKTLYSLFQKTSLLFYIVFGMHYQPSLKMLLTILLWIYLAFIFKNLFIYFTYSKFQLEKMQYLGIGAGLSILFSLSTGLNKTLEFFIWLANKGDSFFIQLIYSAGICLALLVIYSIMSNVLVEKIKKYGKKNELVRQGMLDSLVARILNLENKRDEKEDEDEEELEDMPDVEEPADFDKA